MHRLCSQVSRHMLLLAALALGIYIINLEVDMHVLSGPPRGPSTLSMCISPSMHVQCFDLLLQNNILTLYFAESKKNCNKDNQLGSFRKSKYQWCAISFQIIFPRTTKMSYFEFGMFGLILGSMNLIDLSHAQLVVNKFHHSQFHKI